MSWYIAMTNPQAELRVERALREIKVDHYLPRESRQGRVRGRVDRSVVIKRPLLPGYVFIDVDHPRQSFMPIRDLEGVRGFLRNPGALYPSEIPAEFVGDLMLLEADGQFDYTPKAPKTVVFEQGQPVRITGGAWSGILAEIVEACAGSDRVIILGRLFGGLCQMTIDRDKLEAA